MAATEKRKPGTFTKGDPRINRNGRPKSFDAFRKLAVEIAGEKVIKDGEPVTINGHVLTVAEAILRQWGSSKNPKLQMAFIEVAFGKPPENVNVHGEFEKAEVILYLPKKEDINENSNPAAAETGTIPQVER